MIALELPQNALAYNMLPELETAVDDETVKSARGRNLKNLRQLRNITQLELAYAIGYNSSGTISLIERGIKGMSLEKRRKAAIALGVHPLVLEWPGPLSDRKLTILVNFMEILSLDEEHQDFQTIENLVKLIAKGESSPPAS